MTDAAPKTAIVITCEHGGNNVPPAYAALFLDHQALLSTHRGWDPGALELAQQMASALHAPLFASTTTRLLIDLNRSIGHRALHSEATRHLSIAQRKNIAAQYYRPHRDEVEGAIAVQIAAGKRVVHIASHSFTPELNGVVRQADVGFLYNPQRAGERTLAQQWLQALHQSRPDLKLRRNYPYQGKGDGLTSLLRKRHSADQYIGMELEVNQRFVVAGGQDWTVLQNNIVQALACAVKSLDGQATVRQAGDLTELQRETTKPNRDHRP